MLAVAEMQSLTGERVSGASLASTGAIERKLELTTKPICFVRAWVVIDVDGVDPSVTRGSHLLPLVMYSHYVVSHGTDQLARGDRVLTRFASHYDPSSIFETAGTVYIMLRSGFRRSSGMETVRAALKPLSDEEFDRMMREFDMASVWMRDELALSRLRAKTTETAPGNTDGGYQNADKGT